MDPISGAILGSAASALIGGIFSKGQQQRQITADRKINREERAYNEKWDIGIPFHKLGNQSREAIWSDVQRGQDMDTATNKIRLGQQSAQQRADEVWKYNALKGEGATLQEIMGAPPAGGVSSSPGSGGNVMGNQTSQMMANASQVAQQNMQMKWQSSENAKDRQLQLAKLAVEAGGSLGNILTERRGQDVSLTRTQMDNATKEITAEIAADASIKSSSITASAQIQAAKIAQSTAMAQLKEATRVNDYEVARIASQTALLDQQQAFDAVLHNERWQKIAASMGVDNFRMALVAAGNGTDVEKVLTMQGMSKADQREFLRVANEIVAQNAIIFRETEGAKGVVGNTWDWLRGKQHIDSYRAQQGQ